MTTNNRLDVAQTASFLRERDCFHLCCHNSPDGDTIGSALALYYALTAMGKKVTVLCADEFPSLFDYLFEGYQANCEQPETKVAIDIASPGLISKSLESYRDQFDLCIDHHPSNAMYAANTLLREDAAATAEIIYDVIRALEVPISQPIASALYTGIATDTGCFRYTNTTSDTHRIAADLALCGVPMGWINIRIFETKSRARVALEQQLLAGMEFHLDGQVSVLCVTRDLLQQTGASLSDLDGISGMARQIEGVQVGLLFKEQPDGSYKVSVRTNEGYDASQLCRPFGGGGHMRAAGCSIAATFAEARDRFLDVIRQYRQTTADE